MELRTRILPKMLNSEVEAYLEHNDIIIVPVGTVEMHGGSRWTAKRSSAKRMPSRWRKPATALR